jgi:PAS domain S-box-containing protein
MTSFLSPGSDIDVCDLVEHAPCGFVVLGLSGTVLFANSVFLQVIGRDSFPVGQDRFQDLLFGGGKLFYETQFAPTLLLRGSVSEIAFDLTGPDRTRVPVLVNARLHRDHVSGETILLSVFAAEQRRLYERELLRARKEFEQVAEVVRRSSDAILRVAADGTIQTWNAGAEHIFGLLPDDILEEPLAALFDPDDSDVLLSALSDVRAGREAAREMNASHRSGRRLQLSVSLTPHMEAPGVLVAFSAVIRDVTSQKLAERALIQNEKLASVGRLASSIAHEINNPLASVTNLLYILQSRVKDEETSALVMTAQEELARVSHIATHTLRFHKQSTSPTEIDVGALVTSVLSLYQRRLESSGVATTNDSQGVSPLVCLEGELRQVMVNLVSNAFDSMRGGGGRLTVRSRDVTLWHSGGQGVCITVADTGSGMDEETLRQAFVPFFSTKGIGGTGLGLWITQDLVRKNGGSIRIRSSNLPGRSGTVVMMFVANRPLNGGAGHGTL